MRIILIEKKRKLAEISVIKKTIAKLILYLVQWGRAALKVRAKFQKRVESAFHLPVQHPSK